MHLVKNYQFRFMLLTVAVCLLILLFSILIPEIIHKTVWKTLLFLGILTFLISILNTYLVRNFPENFLHIVVLGMILRFIATLVYIGLLVWQGMENIILFIANFFILFLFYLVFDIYTIISNLRQISR